MRVQVGHTEAQAADRRKVKARRRAGESSRGARAVIHTAGARRFPESIYGETDRRRWIWVCRWCENRGGSEVAVDIARRQRCRVKMKPRTGARAPSSSRIHSEECFVCGEGYHHHETGGTLVTHYSSPCYCLARRQHHAHVSLLAMMRGTM